MKSLLYQEVTHSSCGLKFYVYVERAVAAGFGLCIRQHHAGERGHQARSNIRQSGQKT